MMVFFNLKKKKKNSFKSSNLKRGKILCFYIYSIFSWYHSYFVSFFFWHHSEKKSLPSLKPEIFLQWIGNLFVPYQPSVSKSSCYIEAYAITLQRFLGTTKLSCHLLSTRLFSRRTLLNDPLPNRTKRIVLQRSNAKELLSIPGTDSKISAYIFPPLLMFFILINIYIYVCSKCLLLYDIFVNNPK